MDPSFVGMTKEGSVDMTKEGSVAMTKNGQGSGRFGLVGCGFGLG